MSVERVREVYEATERSWESTAAQWMTVFDAVKHNSDGLTLGPMEQAVWNAYRQARQLRKLVVDLWEDSLMESRARMRQEVLGGHDADPDSELVY